MEGSPLPIHRVHQIQRRHESSKRVTTLTVLSLILVVLTPAIYFCGRAFHDGWYEALRLDSGMFPSDTRVCR